MNITIEIPFPDSPEPTVYSRGPDDPDATDNEEQLNEACAAMMADMKEDCEGVVKRHTYLGCPLASVTIGKLPNSDEHGVIIFAAWPSITNWEGFASDLDDACSIYTTEWINEWIREHC